MRTCEICGREIEAERSKLSRLCLACARPGTTGNVVWCRKWEMHRKKMTDLRRAKLPQDSDRANIRYTRHDPDLGPVVVSVRRGFTKQSDLKGGAKC